MLDLILTLIFYLVISPYKALSQFMKNHGVGVSKSEQKSLTFWKLVALVGGGLLLFLFILLLLFDIL